MQQTKNYNILTINPGSTSTKLALFTNEKCITNFEVEKTTKSGLRGEQLDAEIADYVSQIKALLADYKTFKLDAIVGRGGFLKRDKQQIEGGVYKVAWLENNEIHLNKDIIASVRDFPEMEHASNLGIPIAASLAQEYKVPAFTVDPVVADEFCPEAQYSGYQGITRKSTSHVLSVRALARKAAKELDQPFHEINLVVAHMGGGITIAAIKKGKIIDNNIALLGGGSFTPQRVGTLPMSGLISLCYSGKFSEKELKYELCKKGGLTSYLNEDSMLKIEERIANGDQHAKQVLKAMSYQIAKEIGAMYVVAGCNAKAIILSGGLAKSELFMNMLNKRIQKLAPVIIYTQNLEMSAMANGALRVLHKTETAKQFAIIN